MRTLRRRKAEMRCISCSPSAKSNTARFSAMCASSSARGTAAAVANAVFHATGIRVRELPIRLEKLIA